MDVEPDLHLVRFECFRPTQCGAGNAAADSFIQLSLSPDAHRSSELRWQELSNFTWPLLSAPTALSTLPDLLYYLVSLCLWRAGWERDWALARHSAAVCSASEFSTMPTMVATNRTCLTADIVEPVM